MNSIKVCEYSWSRSFHDDLILQDQASGELSQDQWSSGSIIYVNKIGQCNYCPLIIIKIIILLKKIRSPVYVATTQQINETSFPFLSI